MSEIPVWERSPEPPVPVHAPVDPAVLPSGPGPPEHATRSASNQALQRLLEDRPAEPRTGGVWEWATPASQPGSADLQPFQELPVQQAVRLVKPLTPPEVAQELYGDAKHWRALVLAPNRALLSTNQGDRLPVGTQLRVLPELLGEPMRGVFMLVATLARQGREGGSKPYVHASPDSPAAVGNVVRYSFAWPNALLNDVLVDWWLEHDPVAVRSEGAPARVEGPKGYLSVRGNGWWLVTFDVPGMHMVHCRMRTVHETHDLSHPQMVMTLEERTEVAAAAKPKPPIPPERLLAELKQQKVDMKVTDANVDEYGVLLDRIADLEAAISRTGKDGMKPLSAIYVSSTEAPVTLPLTVYFGLDPDRAGRPDLYFYLRLWDFTAGGKERTYTASDKSLDAAVRKLLEGFADDAPYPKGNIRFHVEETDLSWSGSERSTPWSYAARTTPRTLTFPTDGGWFLDDLLRVLSGVALGVGLGAAMIAPPAAVPILWVSGALAGAAAAVSLTDRIAHGEAKWDLQTVTDVLDIASALLSLGAIAAASEMVEGLGRMTLTGALELSIGKAQLGIMAGIHVTEITAAINTKDEQRVAAALSGAIRDGAILIILHRASARPTQPEGPQPRFLPEGRAANEDVETPLRRLLSGPAANENVEVRPPPPEDRKVVPIRPSEAPGEAVGEPLAGTGTMDPGGPRAMASRKQRGRGERPQRPPVVEERTPSQAATRPSQEHPDLPDAQQDQAIRDYVRELAELRKAREFYERAIREQATAEADPKRMNRARAAVEGARRRLDAMEKAAAEESSGMLLRHLEPFIDEAGRIVKEGAAATTTGQRVDCEVVKEVAQHLGGRLRGADYADLERALGPPHQVTPPSGIERGAATATSQGRLEWRFSDGSRLVIDAPQRIEGRPESANRPHAEFHGPAGERLDPQGIVVPKQSIAAHLTITDRSKSMRDRFIQAKR